ncbi:GNAT family N-acetyltransferase [Chitinophaga polysaccharea]|uniref:GNAT family N-acetyltransferase n=1 Tax=Chitinophaga polysaccharea TaxID=1293035 RepID=UPI0014552CEA|nr:GNAT family N-acetyltransferase [Chitinophaga polysaccharea]NLR61195.1 GNAT family N-acetyltransferase [Chitinophaga polysaccharea]
MDVTIRAAREEDFAQIYQLIREFAHFIKTPEKVAITLPQMIQDKDHFQCMVAIYQDQIIGFATWFFAYYSWSGKAVYLDDLYVKDQYRGQAIGTALMDAVIAKAREAGCKKVRWQVSNWNQHAIEFYKKRGAQIDEVEINCDLVL